MIDVGGVIIATRPHRHTLSNPMYFLMWIK